MSGNSDFKELASTRTQDAQQLNWLLSDIKPPRRSESAPPFLACIFQHFSSSSPIADDTQQSALGRSNFAPQQLRGPWDALSWGTIPKHRSLDTRHLEGLPEESETHSFFAALTEEAQTPSSLPPFTKDPLVPFLVTPPSPPPLLGSANLHKTRMASQEPSPESSITFPDVSSASAADLSMSHADLACSAPQSLPPLRLAPGHMASPSASPQGHGPATKSPAPSQRSSPHQPLPPASSQSQGGVAPSHSTAEAPAQSAVQQGGDESDQQLSPGGTAPTAHAQPAAQHAQHAGQGSFKHAGHPRRQGQQHMGHSYQHHALGQQWSGSDGGWYPPYGQPPPPPPMTQHHRPSTQWRAGLGQPFPPRSHDGGGSYPSMGPRLPPQAQQSMGMGMYPGPYGIVPGMQHHQGAMQPPVYMHNGYMMIYPPIPPGNMHIYGMENGTPGVPPRPLTNFPQSAPFPPALDPHYAEYIQQLSQQQVFPGAPLSTLTHVERASKIGKEAASQSSSKGQGVQHMRNANGFHRRSPSGLSTASSATSGDRDRSSRHVQDRRGDAATATSSSAGLRTRGGSGDTPATAADADRLAQATVLLEQSKAKNKPQSFELKDIKGFVFEFCRDQHGSRFIQQKLADAPPEAIMEVFEEVQPHVITLMQDVFGNYVIQKCFEHGTKEVLELLAGLLWGHVLALSLHMYGCRVIQKALEVLHLEQQRVIVHELQGQVMRCVRDQNGNHVIQKIIERVKPTTEIVSILEDITGSVVGLSTHPYGCRVVQRVLEHCTIENVKAFIRRQILQSTASLATDQYGNYVIQHMLEHGPDSARQEIIEKLVGQAVRLSQHKFASNVIEKCLQFGDSAGRQAMIQEVVGQPEGAPPDSGPLQMMTKDQYANYVVQKMLEVCDDSQRQLLMARITAHLNQLKKLTYGKHIVARVEKLLVAGNAAAVQQESEVRSADASNQDSAQVDSTGIFSIADQQPTAAEQNETQHSRTDELCADASCSQEPLA